MTKYTQKYKKLCLAKMIRTVRSESDYSQGEPGELVVTGIVTGSHWKAIPSRRFVLGKSSMTLEASFRVYSLIKILLC